MPEASTSVLNLPEIVKTCQMPLGTTENLPILCFCQNLTAITSVNNTLKI